MISEFTKLRRYVDQNTYTDNIKKIKTGIEDYLVKDKVQTYILQVKGDSMIDAGIQEGDLVIAEKREDAKVGDIVIADLDGGWTMKYFRKRGVPGVGHETSVKQVVRRLAKRPEVVGVHAVLQHLDG